jgi:hypothetical protein
MDTFLAAVGEMRKTSFAMTKALFVIPAAVLALALPGAAAASQPPTLLNVSQQNRHPSATFSMPGADDATIYFADKPDRASDGSFLQENVKYLDFFTTDEIQSGSWTYESQIDPGTYYVMVQATDYDCIGQPPCIDGYSNMLTLSVPKPHQTYRGSVDVLHYAHIVYLTLRVNPLGEPLPYKVCWRLRSGKRRCVSGKVEGYSWDDSASDELSVRLRGMKKRTTFVWYVQGHKVAAKTANTVRY